MSADRLPWDEAERAFRVHDLCPQKAGAGVRAICPHCLDDPAGGWLYVERVGEDARPVCDAGCKPAAIVAALRAPADHEAPARGLRPPVLKAAALHGPAGELVRTIDPHTEADPAATLIQFLLAFGNACGRGLGFRVESDDHGVNEFAAIVGDTAKARKGTSWGHVRRLMQMVDWAWAEGCIASGVASGEGLIHAVRDPVVTRRKARKGEQADKDGRIEVEDDPGVDDKRLFVIQGELAQVLRVMRKDGNTVSPVVRDLWDSGNARNMSKGSPQRTTEAHVSMVGHITHRELVQELTEVESANGFANRWLWVWARRSKRLPRGGDLSDWTLAALAEPIRNALRFAKKLRDEGQATLDMTEDAWGVWEVLYERLAEGEDDLTGAITARAEAHVRRLAVIYALLDQRSIVGIEHLQAAIAVWDYCEASARLIFGDKVGDPLTDKLLDAIEAAAEDGIDRTDIRGVAGGHVPAEEIDGALSDLAIRGLAHERVIQTGGRPAHSWYPGDRSEVPEASEERSEADPFAPKPTHFPPASEGGSP